MCNSEPHRSVKSRVFLPSLSINLAVIIYSLMQIWFVLMSQKMVYGQPANNITRFHTWINKIDSNIYNAPTLSIAYADSAYEYALKVDSLHWQAIALNRLGAGHWSKGDLSQALVELSKSLDLSVEQGYSDLSARNLGNIGNVHAMAGDKLTAITYYHEALLKYQSLGMDDRANNMYGNIGKSYLDYNELDSGEKYLQMAIKTLGNNRQREPILWFNMAELAFKKGEYTKASLLLDEDIEKAMMYDDHRALARVYQLRAELSLVAGDNAKALQQATKANDIALTTETKELTMLTLTTLARAYAANGDYNNAYLAYETANMYDDSLQTTQVRNQLDVLKHKKEQTAFQLLEQQKIFAEHRSDVRQKIIMGLLLMLILAMGSLLVLMKNRQLIAEQKNELNELNTFKNRVFAIVSHDLRSPIINLASILKIVSSKIASPEEIAHHLPAIQTRVNNLVDLMDNLMLWASASMKGDILKLENVNVNKMAREVIDKTFELYAEKKIEIKNEIEENMYVNTDPRLISIVLRNLLVNAMKFSYENGHVRVQGSNNGHGISLSVIDAGVGMDTKTLKKLFTDKVKKSQGTMGEAGSGIGLTLCRDFVERLDGKISVVSEPGKGSTFTVVLPNMRDDHQEM